MSNPRFRCKDPHCSTDAQVGGDYCLLHTPITLNFDTVREVFDPIIDAYVTRLAKMGRPDEKPELHAAWLKLSTAHANLFNAESEFLAVLLKYEKGGPNDG